MTLPDLSGEIRSLSKSRCPRFGRCDAPLCPLDPYFITAAHVPGKPLCYWYTNWQFQGNLKGIPDEVASQLPIYSVYLHISGALNPRRAKVVRRRLRNWAQRRLSDSTHSSGRG